MTKEQQFTSYLDQLVALHQKYDCVWSDFFAATKDRFLQDSAFGYDYLITAYGGMFNYEDSGVVDNKQDEALRLQTAEAVYNLAKELKHDQN